MGALVSATEQRFRPKLVCNDDVTPGRPNYDAVDTPFFRGLANGLVMSAALWAALVVFIIRLVR